LGIFYLYVLRLNRTLVPGRRSGVVIGATAKVRVLAGSSSLMQIVSQFSHPKSGKKQAREKVQSSSRAFAVLA